MEIKTKLRELEKERNRTITKTVSRTNTVNWSPNSLVPSVIGDYTYSLLYGLLPKGSLERLIEDLGNKLSAKKREDLNKELKSRHFFADDYSFGFLFLFLAASFCGKDLPPILSKEIQQAKIFCHYRYGKMKILPQKNYSLLSNFCKSLKGNMIADQLILNTRLHPPFIIPLDEVNQKVDITFVLEGNLSKLEHFWGGHEKTIKWMKKMFQYQTQDEEADVAKLKSVPSEPEYLEMSCSISLGGLCKYFTTLEYKKKEDPLRILNRETKRIELHHFFVAISPTFQIVQIIQDLGIGANISKEKEKKTKEKEKKTKEEVFRKRKEFSGPLVQYDKIDDFRDRYFDSQGYLPEVARFIFKLESIGIESCDTAKNDKGLYFLVRVKHSKVNEIISQIGQNSVFVVEEVPDDFRIIHSSLKIGQSVVTL